VSDLVPFFDAHVHFWDHDVPGLAWGWLRAGFTQGTRVEEHDIDRPRFTPVELREEAAGTGLAAVAHVQAAEPMDDPALETAWLSRLADEQQCPDVIVAACKLRAPDAPEMLRRHAAFGRFRSVRDLWLSPRTEPDQVGPAMAVAAELGVSIEISLPMAAFPMMRALADAHPGVTFVLGHGGFPKTRDPALFDEWTAAMRDLAAAPNFVCKISATTGRGNPGWTVDNTRPWVLGCIEAFGVERCLAGSNWPYDQPVATYAGIVAQLRGMLDDLSSDEQHAVLHGTAERLYRFSLPAS
jgi:predicted TIM-barrel fold metal-dependent hydrolase